MPRAAASWMTKSPTPPLPPMTSIDGPAGSGKTKTLTNRIIHLLNQGVPADQILALAFNRKAALEMSQRLKARGVKKVEIRTFHALGYQILREALDKSRSKKQILHMRSPLREDFQPRWWPKPWVWPART